MLVTKKELVFNAYRVSDLKDEKVLESSLNNVNKLNTTEQFT